MVTGGARSGKSALAEGLVQAMGARRVYIATAEAFDEEMVARIAAHQARRGLGWTTHAEPLELVQALHDTDGGPPRLVDCLTLWLSNLIHAGRDWQEEAQALAGAIAEQAAPVVFVTNEVGGGIVPENALGRRFRDAAGHLNQTVAAACDEVYLSVAGYPLKVKPNDITF